MAMTMTTAMMKITNKVDHMSPITLCRFRSLPDYNVVRARICTDLAEQQHLVFVIFYLKESRLWEKKIIDDFSPIKVWIKWCTNVVRWNQMFSIFIECRKIHKKRDDEPKTNSIVFYLEAKGSPENIVKSINYSYCISFFHAIDKWMEWKRIRCYSFVATIEVILGPKWRLEIKLIPSKNWMMINDRWDDHWIL